MKNTEIFFCSYIQKLQVIYRVSYPKLTRFILFSWDEPSKTSALNESNGSSSHGIECTLGSFIFAVSKEKKNPRGYSTSALNEGHKLVKKG